jgi:uncharacterized protein (TIGR00255 family)
MEPAIMAAKPIRGATAATRLRSMTGFAHRTVQEDGFLLTMNLRSVNHRSLDLHVALPDLLQRLEPAVRKEIAAKQPRGHVQLRVTVERDASSGPLVDEQLVERYIQIFRQLGAQHGMPLEIALQNLSQLPGVIATSSSHSQRPVSPELETAFLAAIRETLDDWDSMRVAEGMVLEEDFRNRALTVRSLMIRVERLRKEMVPVAQKRLRDRLHALLGENGLDAARLAQEAALLAEHTDISEEVVRLNAHVDQFLGMLDGQPEIGKKLDFLLQEIQRELNTLLAKTAGLGESGLPMTQVALDIKAEIEKLREQVQNVQ